MALVVRVDKRKKTTTPSVHVCLALYRSWRLVEG